MKTHRLNADVCELVGHDFNDRLPEFCVRCDQYVYKFVLPGEAGIMDNARNVIVATAQGFLAYIDNEGKIRPLQP